VEKSAYLPWWKSAEVTLVGAASLPKEVRVGDQVTHEWRYDSQTHSVTLTVTDALSSWSVNVAY
jgi:hypothetical protein